MENHNRQDLLLTVIVNSGQGTKVLHFAKEHGISNFTGMIDPQNDVIQKLLIKLGYKVKYSLESGFYKVAIFV